VIASLARYHRKSLPKKRHDSWMPLIPEEKALVERLSLLLRLAVAMDRRPGGAVRKVMARCSRNKLKLQLEPIDVSDDLSLELWSLQTCAPLIQSAVGISLSSGLLRSAQPLAV
jgi:exopolyphosphatase/guanosine-5'-triphosphate,3'-diphosphate pyrophosphatase